MNRIQYCSASPLLNYSLNVIPSPLHLSIYILHPFLWVTPPVLHALQPRLGSLSLLDHLQANTLASRGDSTFFTTLDSLLYFPLAGDTLRTYSCKRLR
jgi:hypothetical protein